MRSICRTLAYVPHHAIPAWEQLGWMVVNTLPAPHSQWSVLMGWPCACEARTPRKEAA